MKNRFLLQILCLNADRYLDKGDSATAISYIARAKAKALDPDDLNLGKNSRDFLRLLQTEMQILIRAGDKSEEVLDLCKQAYQLAKKLYGESGNKTIIDAKFDLAIAMINDDAQKGEQSNEGEELLNKTLVEH